MHENDFKQIVLSRFCGEFLPAEKGTATIRKTSEDIRCDLRSLADISINEIAEFLISLGYYLDFDDGMPVWLMQKAEPGKIDV